jgi:hypothetical protein
MSEMRLFCLYITCKPNQNIPRGKNSSKDHSTRPWNQTQNRIPYTQYT